MGTKCKADEQNIIVTLTAGNRPVTLARLKTGRNGEPVLILNDDCIKEAGIIVEHARSEEMGE